MRADRRQCATQPRLGSGVAVDHRVRSRRGVGDERSTRNIDCTGDRGGGRSRFSLSIDGDAVVAGQSDVDRIGKLDVRVLRLPRTIEHGDRAGRATSRNAHRDDRWSRGRLRYRRIRCRGPGCRRPRGDRRRSGSGCRSRSSRALLWVEPFPWGGGLGTLGRVAAVGVVVAARVVGGERDRRADDAQGEEGGSDDDPGPSDGVPNQPPVGLANLPSGGDAQSNTHDGHDQAHQRDNPTARTHQRRDRSPAPSDVLR